MRRRLLVLLAGFTLCGGTALVTTPPAQADATMPGTGPYWSSCTDSTDRYCVESMQRNGVEITPDGAGIEPYVDTLDSGTIRYGVYDYDADPDSPDVSPADSYRLVVRSGAVRPREMFGNVASPTFSTSYSATTGWKFTIAFRPTPVHWVGFGGDGRACQIGACGDDSWRASLDYGGFVTGYVTDLASSGLSSTEINQRTGLVRGYNAQAENTFYDPGTNSVVVQLANPHRTGSGAVATGSYETFLPNAFLTGAMGVPDPATLSTGTLTVVRSAGGADSSAPFTLTHVPGGVRITITGITYSSPTYRIHPGPGQPRKVHARKISAHKARVRFAKPASNGGYRVNRYQARCHKLGRAWHSAKRTSSPITVGHLPKRKVYCQVRAHNKLGWGAWSATKHT